VAFSSIFCDWFNLFYSLGFVGDLGINLCVYYNCRIFLGFGCLGFGFRFCLFCLLSLIIVGDWFNIFGGLGFVGNLGIKSLPLSSIWGFWLSGIWV
jgi:hypothetical protein